LLSAAMGRGGVTDSVLQLGKGYTNPGCQDAVVSNFVPLRPKFLAPQYATCCISPLWRPGFWGGS